MFGYIYLTENVITGKKYIGQKRGNFCPMYKGSGVYLKEALNLYGKENFIVSLIEEAKDVIELNDKERYWISYYNAAESDDFYNLSTGGDCWGSPKSSSTREKIRQKALGRPAPNKGIPNPKASEMMLKNNPMKKPEVAAKCSASLKGKPSPHKIIKKFTWNCKWCQKTHEDFDTIKKRKAANFCNKSCAASFSNTKRKKDK
jgi:hypothetical protein